MKYVSKALLCHPQHELETGASALPWLLFAYERQAAAVIMSAASSSKPDALIPICELLPVETYIVGTARSDAELVEWAYIKPSIRPKAKLELFIRYQLKPHNSLNHYLL